MTDQVLALYSKLVLIRRFEEKVLSAFKEGVFHGTTHTSIGQEADAVGVISQLAPEDIIVSNHRCHGHFLAYGGSPRALFAELMGKPVAVCGGRGGSQHLHWRNFYSNGIQGGIMPMAAGMALAEKTKNSQAITAVFIGDGTLGQGVVYETLNMASLWGLPLLIVLENNHIAQTTPSELTVAGKIADRFKAFDIPVEEINSSDVMAISGLAGRLIADVRHYQRPQALIVDTVRFGPHSKGDDTRSQEDLQALMRTRDPLCIQASRIPRDVREDVDQEVEALIEKSYQEALNDPDYDSLRGAVGETK